MHKFFITATIKREMKIMRMKYKNIDTPPTTTVHGIHFKSYRTTQISEFIGQLIPSPSQFTLQLSPLLPLAETMETTDRVISPTSSSLLTLP
jgi:hypothetical protein